MSVPKRRTVLLFDIDGTLTLPRQKMDQTMRDFLMEVRRVVPLAVVSGSDLPKVVEQLGEDLEDGRSCTQEERLQFVQYDKEHCIRQKFVEKLKNFTKGWDLNICIGGQISVDVFPCGWDKTFCMRYLSDFDTVHFFGDKTAPGGNDHDLYIDPRTIGHTVKDPENTRELVREVLKTL